MLPNIYKFGLLTGTSHIVLAEQCFQLCHSLPFTFFGSHKTFHSSFAFLPKIIINYFHIFHHLITAANVRQLIVTAKYFEENREKRRKRIERKKAALALREPPYFIFYDRKELLLNQFTLCFSVCPSIQFNIICTLCFAFAVWSTITRIKLIEVTFSSNLPLFICSKLELSDC